MTLGMISWIREEDFQRVKAKGLSFVELDVNDRVKEFLDALEQTKEYSKKYDLPVAAIGRWGSARIDENGIREEELAIEYSLIDAAAELGTGIYITGCNYVDSLSYYENCSFAIAYFEKLIAYGKEKNIKIARVNPECIWLSESVEPEFIVDMRAKGMTNLSDSEIFQAFDMCYDYDIFKYFRQYLNGEGTLGRYVEAVNMQEYIYPANYVKMRYLENHDQDRAKEIIPKESALRNWTAFLYFQKGATLLYAGQENQNETRPDLFNKDVINLDGSRDISDMLRQLYQIKKLPVVAKSSYRLSADEGLGAAIGEHKEIQGKGRLLGIFSFEGKCGQVEAGIQDGTYTNMVNGKEIRIEDGKIDLKMCPVIIKENGE